MIENIKSGLRSLLSRHREQLFLLLCLAGLLPALVTNTLYTTAAFPGIESFYWSWLALGTWRYLFAAVLLAAVLVGWRLENRRLLLAVLPLLGLVLAPLDRIGAVQRYHFDNTAQPYDLARARGQLAALEQPAGAFSALLDKLPPKIASTSWLLQKLSQLEITDSKIAGHRRSIKDLEAQVGQYRRQRTQLVRQADDARRGSAHLPPFMQRPVMDPYLGKMGGLDRQIANQQRQIRAIQDDIESLRQAAAPGLTDLRVSVMLHTRWKNEKAALYKSSIYLLPATLLWLWFIWTHGVGNRVMAALFAMAVPLSFSAAGREWGSEWLFLCFAALYPLFIALVTALSLRMLFRAIQDNREIWHLFERRALLRSGAVALALWSPFAAVLALNLALGPLVQKIVSARIYCQHIDLTQCVKPEQALVYDSDPPRDTLREDLHASVERIYAQFEAQAIAAAAGVNGVPTNRISSIKPELLKRFDQTVKPAIWDYDKGLAKRDCGWFAFSCYAHNIGVGVANDAYEKPRNRMRDSFEARVSAATDKLLDATKEANKTAVNAARDFEGAIRGEAALASAETRKLIDFTLLVFAGFAVVSTAILFMVVIRALLLILARLLFRQNKAIYTPITHTETVATPAAPCTVTVSETSHIQVDPKHTPLLAKKRFDVDNAAPESLWRPPQAFTWMFSRMFNRCWGLKRIAVMESSHPISFGTSEGARFVAWEIPAGAEVVFRWDSFVAMSETAEFRKTISLKMGTLVLGHVMLPSVRGPGLLIQRTYGAPSPASASVAPARLLAWSVGTPFRIEASTRLLSIYVDHCQMRAHADGAAVLDAPREGRGGHGLLSELLRLFRP